MNGFRVGSGIFRPRLWPTLLTLLMLPVLLGLGTWQVHRLHWKRELLATIDRRIHRAPVDLPLPDAGEADFHPAKASGVFRNELSFYVFSTALASGQGGYHVVTPMQLDDGEFLFVDRGWIPYGFKQQPDGFAHPEGHAQVQGILRAPASHLWLQPRNDPAKGRWYSIDLAAMARADKLGAVLPYMLEADATPNEGGYPVGGQTRLDLPNDHFSYAVTWYGFAAILTIIYGVSSWRKDSADRSASKSEA